MDPTFSTFPVSYFSPGIVFLDNFNWNQLLAEPPFDWVTDSRSNPHIHFIGTKRDKPPSGRTLGPSPQRVFGLRQLQ
jgi:hypothetical protein